jgi:hypothetical protein
VSASDLLLRAEFVLELLVRLWRTLGFRSSWREGLIGASLVSACENCIAAQSAPSAAPDPDMGGTGD